MSDFLLTVCRENKENVSVAVVFCRIRKIWSVK